MAAAAGTNFITVQSAKLTVGAASSSITFTNSGGETQPSFMIDNTGTGSAYIAFGTGTATAIASSSTPAANCIMVNSGECKILSAPPGNITVAAIQGSGATTLEISIGIGQ